MEIGVVTWLTDYGIKPVTLGRAVERCGFSSLFVTEHTHIPVSWQFPGPGDLPPVYAHTYDPFVALGAIAAVTDRIALGTAVSLVAQHDPIVLAKAVASVDQISGGRFELGVGPGFIPEEAVNHGVRARRTARMLETVAALRAIWSADEAEFHGEFIDFDPIYLWPKPVRIPPVLIGGNGPGVVERVLEHGEGWMPLDTGPDDLERLASRVSELRQRAASMGRARPSVTVYGAAQVAELLESYADAGVDRVLFELADHGDDHNAALAELEELANSLPQ